MTRCATGKVAHRNLGIAIVAARGHHRQLNRDGIIAQTLYAYSCRRCKSWHLTRMAEYQGRPHKIAAEAASVELQQWAFPSAR